MATPICISSIQANSMFNREISGNMSFDHPFQMTCGESVSIHDWIYNFVIISSPLADRRVMKPILLSRDLPLRSFWVAALCCWICSRVSCLHETQWMLCSITRSKHRKLCHCWVISESFFSTISAAISRRQCEAKFASYWLKSWWRHHWCCVEAALTELYSLEEY